MSATSKIAVGVASGYLLGRTKKLKLAITVGSMLAGRKIATDPQALLAQAQKLVDSNPELQALQDQIKGNLFEAAKAAALGQMTSRLSSATDSLRLQLETGTKKPQDEDESDEESAEDEEESEEEPQDEEESEEEPQDEEESEEEPQDEEEPTAEKDESEQPQPRGRPRRTSAQSSSRTAKGTAKKSAGTAKKTSGTASKGTGTAKKTAGTAKKSAAKTSASSSSRNRTRG